MSFFLRRTFMTFAGWTRHWWITPGFCWNSHAVRRQSGCTWCTRGPATLVFFRWIFLGHAARPLRILLFTLQPFMVVLVCPSLRCRLICFFFFFFGDFGVGWTSCFNFAFPSQTAGSVSCQDETVMELCQMDFVSTAQNHEILWHLVGRLLSVHNLHVHSASAWDVISTFDHTVSFSDLAIWGGFVDPEQRRPATPNCRSWIPEHWEKRKKECISRRYTQTPCRACHVGMFQNILSRPKPWLRKKFNSPRCSRRQMFNKTNHWE